VVSTGVAADFATLTTIAGPGRALPSMRMLPQLLGWEPTSLQSRMEALERARLIRGSLDEAYIVGTIVTQPSLGALCALTLAAARSNQFFGRGPVTTLDPCLLLQLASGDRRQFRDETAPARHRTIRRYLKLMVGTHYLSEIEHGRYFVYRPTPKLE